MNSPSFSTRFLFRQCSEANLDPLLPMSLAIQSVFSAALTFCHLKKAKGESAIDVSTSFKRKGLTREFEAYLRGTGRKFRHTLN